MAAPTGPQFENVEELYSKPGYRSVGATYRNGGDSYTYMAKLTSGGVNVDVTHKNKTVGSLYGSSSEQTPSSIEITGVDVSPQYRRRGIATNMLLFARQHALEGTSIEHSDQLTASGKQFVKGLKNKGID